MSLGGDTVLSDEICINRAVQTSSPSQVPTMTQPWPLVDDVASHLGVAKGWICRVPIRRTFLVLGAHDSLHADGSAAADRRELVQKR